MAAELLRSVGFDPTSLPPGYLVTSEGVWTPPGVSLVQEDEKPASEQLADVQIQEAKAGKISSDDLFNDAETFLSQDADETSKILNMD